MKLDYGTQNAALITLFTQEMLKRGYLVAPSVYVSLAHTKEIISEYLNNVDDVFKILARAIRNQNITDKLQTNIKEEGFKRLN